MKASFCLAASGGFILTATITTRQEYLFKCALGRVVHARTMTHGISYDRENEAYGIIGALKITVIGGEHLMYAGSRWWCDMKLESVKGRKCVTYRRCDEQSLKC